MGLFDVQAVCDRMWGRGNGKRPFYFCFECVVVFGILAHVLMKHTFYKSLKTRDFFILVKLLLEQNDQYASVQWDIPFWLYIMTIMQYVEYLTLITP